MRLYRKLPVTVEVVRFLGEDEATVEAFAGPGWLDWHEIQPGDYIVKDVGSVDVYSPERFAASFAPLL